MPHAKRKQRRFNRQHLQSLALQLRRRQQSQQPKGQQPQQRQQQQRRLPPPPPPRFHLVEGAAGAPDSVHQPLASGDSINTFDLSEFPHLGSSAAAWTSDDDGDDEGEEEEEGPNDNWEAMFEPSTSYKVETFEPESEVAAFTITEEDFPALPAFPSPDKSDAVVPASCPSPSSTSAPCANTGSVEALPSQAFVSSLLASTESYPNSSNLSSTVTSSHCQPFQSLSSAIASSPSPSADWTRSSFFATPPSVVSTGTSNTTALSSLQNRRPPPPLRLTTSASSPPVSATLARPWASQSFSSKFDALKLSTEQISESGSPTGATASTFHEETPKVFNPSTAESMPFQAPTNGYLMSNNPARQRVFPSATNSQANWMNFPSSSGSQPSGQFNRRTLSPITSLGAIRSSFWRWLMRTNQLLSNVPLMSQPSVNGRTKESSGTGPLNTFDNRQMPDVQYFKSRAESYQRNINSMLYPPPNLHNSNSQSNISQVSGNSRESKTTSATSICNICELQTLDASFNFSSPGIQYHRKATLNSYGSSWVVFNGGPSKETVKCEGHDTDTPFSLSSSIWQFDRSEMPSFLGSSKNLSEGRNVPTNSGSSDDDVLSKENIPPSIAGSSYISSNSIPTSEKCQMNVKKCLEVADRRTNENVPNTQSANEDCQANKTEIALTSELEKGAVPSLPMFQGYLSSFLKEKESLLLPSRSDGKQTHEDISAMTILKGSSASETFDSCKDEKDIYMKSSSSGIQCDEPTLDNDSGSCSNTLENEPKIGIENNLQDGRITNIPSTLLKDQFGMSGLLSAIRSAETNPNLLELSIGRDLDSYLNPESAPIWPTFDGPWSDTKAARPQDMDFDLMPEYQLDMDTKEKLRPIQLNEYSDDVLLFLFYTNPQEALQLAAAAALYNRDWRYHKVEKAWMSRIPGTTPSEATSSYEIGEFYYFDVKEWRKIVLTTRVVADDLMEGEILRAALYEACSPVRRRPPVNEMRFSSSANPSNEQTSSMTYSSHRPPASSNLPQPGSSSANSFF